MFFTWTRLSIYSNTHFNCFFFCNLHVFCLIKFILNGNHKRKYLYSFLKLSAQSNVKQFRFSEKKFMIYLQTFLCTLQQFCLLFCLYVCCYIEQIYEFLLSKCRIWTKMDSFQSSFTANYRKKKRGRKKYNTLKNCEMYNCQEKSSQ